MTKPISNSEKIGMDESEWRDDPETIVQRTAWIKSIEPFELSPEEEAEAARFNKIMKDFNIEAVRRQMESDPLP